MPPSHAELGASEARASERARHRPARTFSTRIANESVIECTDSLNPYMLARGVAYMVDNCSTTARLGSRKWAPRFDYLIDQVAYVALDQNQPLDTSLIERFKSNTIHPVLAEVGKMRPALDIAVQ
jgi:ketol-acid reductoisomerase